MNRLRVLVAAATAAAALVSGASAVQASDPTYMQCVRATEISCGFPNPVDIDAYQECVAINVPLNCGEPPLIGG